jgi:hypothetical protein
MGWNINTFNNKYQIKYGSNSSYLITSNDISYLTITNDKHIGINNEFPSTNYLLDINGITHINSNFYVDGYSYFSCNIYIKDNIYVDKNIYIKENIITSNIIGGSYNNTSNIIKFNNTSTNNYSNNIVEIYGKTSLFGQVYINKDDKTKPPTQNDYLLDINGSLRADKIYGDGTNISNLNANNIRSGTIPVSQGGTGLNTVNNNQLLYGTVQTNSGINTYSINQSPNLVFDGIKLLCKVSANVLFDGTVSIERGGTGKGSFNKGFVLWGNDDVDIQTSSNFKFENNTLKIVNLQLENSIIKVKTDGEPRNLRASDVGIENASYTTVGLIKASPADFLIDSDGKLELKLQQNTWTTVSGGSGNTADNISKIHFPSLLKYNTVGQQSFVGINIIDPKYDLDVRGTINSSNINSSNYTLNGINLETSLLQKAATESRIASVEYIKDIDLITSNILKENQTILIKGTALNTYNKGGQDDVWRLNKIVPPRFESVNINITTLCRTNKLEIFNNDSILSDTTLGTDDRNTNEIFNIITQNSGITKKLFKFTKAGNLMIGDDLDTPSITLPPERLTIKGNISASGHIRSYYSDSRLKTLTSNITGALNIIDSLSGFYYVPNEKALQLGFEYDNEIGLSAQEVKKVIPEIVKFAPFDIHISNEKIVSKSGEQYLTICYERLGAVFVEAIKELRKENISLKSEINILKKDIDDIKKLIYIN